MMSEEMLGIETGPTRGNYTLPLYLSFSKSLYIDTLYHGCLPTYSMETLPADARLARAAVSAAAR